jgi:hypothetical protein
MELLTISFVSLPKIIAAAIVQNVQRLGYEPITFDQFKLDGKELAEANAKVAISGLNSEARRVRKKRSSATIAVDVRRFGHAINKDEVFGTHRFGP